MKKFAKMSLVAAVAVAGLSSTVSAKPLEEAIKGVDVSGYVTYRYDDASDDKSKVSSNGNTYKAGLKLTTPATDDVKVVVNTSVRAITNDTGTAGTVKGDAAPGIGLTHANFVYTGVKSLTVTAGKQPLNTPWTQGSSTIDSTQAGTGALAMYNAGVATLAAGHFVNNGINGTSNDVGDFTASDLTVVAAIVPVSGMTAQAWFINVGEEETSTFKKGASAYSLDFAGKVSMVSFDARYSSLKSDDANSKRNSLMKLSATADLGMASVTAAFAKTGKDGGLVAFDSDGDAGFSGHKVDLNNKKDGKAFLLAAGTTVGKVDLAATYIDADLEQKAEASEFYVDATYNHAKNLYAMVRLGMNEGKDTAGVKNVDQTSGRLEIGFKF